MNYLVETFRSALKILLSLDRQMLNIVFVSLWVCFTSTLLATTVGLPLGFYLGLKNFRGRQIVVILLNTLMALPTVVVGLLVYSVICRLGPLGSMGLLYTPTAMVIGQFILALPIVAGLCFSATENIDPRIKKTALSLGASPFQSTLTMMTEARLAVISAVMAGFSRVFAEIGVSMMLGGNIKNYTRNITTAIALQTGKGEFALGLALGIILLTVAFIINFIMQYIKRIGMGETRKFLTC